MNKSYRYKITDISKIRFDLLRSCMIIADMTLTSLSNRMRFTKQTFSAWFNRHSMTFHKSDLYYMIDIMSRDANADKIIALYRILYENEYKENMSEIPIPLEKISWNELKRIVDEEL